MNNALFLHFFFYILILCLKFFFSTIFKELTWYLEWWISKLILMLCGLNSLLLQLIKKKIQNFFGFLMFIPYAVSCCNCKYLKIASSHFCYFDFSTSHFRPRNFVVLHPRTVKGESASGPNYGVPLGPLRPLHFRF